jgi:hypothetical protein
VIVATNSAGSFEAYRSSRGFQGFMAVAQGDGSNKQATSWPANEPDGVPIRHGRTRHSINSAVVVASRVSHSSSRAGLSRVVITSAAGHDDGSDHGTNQDNQADEDSRNDPDRHQPEIGALH